MIPKILHLCWFGKGKYNEIVSKCISSWKNKLPDFEIKIWNEDTFDIDSCEFTRIAYKNKKWAFVSDYVRIYALKKYGGVYMDTDVEVVKDLSNLLLEDRFVSSFQEGGFLCTSFIACPPNNAFIGLLLEYYNNKKWTNDNFAIMNPIIFSKIANDYYGIKIGNKSFFNNEFSIFPYEYFIPYRKSIFGKGMKKYKYSKYHITCNTYTIHHELGSWANDSYISKLIRGAVRLILPHNFYDYIKRKRANRIVTNYNIEGINNE